MLVLTRKASESIVIDNTIKVTIVAITGGKVRIGIEAPPDVRVDREEIHQRISQFEEQTPRETGQAIGV